MQRATVSRLRTVLLTSVGTLLAVSAQFGGGSLTSWSGIVDGMV